MLTVDFDRVKVDPGCRILDVGCGSGRHALEAIRRGGEVVALDKSLRDVVDVVSWMAAMGEAGELGRTARGSGVVADALQLPFADESFDLVIAAEVLEHIRDDQAAIDELFRVLRWEGSLVVTVPRFFPELVNWVLSTKYHSTEGGHVRIYRYSQLAERVRSAGLSLREAHYAHALHSPYWWLRCLVGLEKEDHPLVRLYHQLLVWDIVASPPVTRVIESLLNPVLGKSLVLCTVKSR